MKLLHEDTVFNFKFVVDFVELVCSRPDESTFLFIFVQVEVISLDSSDLERLIEYALADGCV